MGRSVVDDLAATVARVKEWLDQLDAERDALEADRNRISKLAGKYLERATQAEQEREEWKRLAVDAREEVAAWNAKWHDWVTREQRFSLEQRQRAESAEARITQVLQWNAEAKARLDAVLSGRPEPSGEYTHLTICNGDRRVPPGSIGVACVCQPGATLALRARLAEVAAVKESLERSIQRIRDLMKEYPG
jgi:hypothetical protein